MYIDIKFPTAVSIIENVLSEEENQSLIDYSLHLKKVKQRGGREWNADTYNTHGTYNIHEDEKFKNLVYQVHQHTNNFARSLNSFYDYNISNSWLNIYFDKDYQEYHNHPKAVFSVVYAFTNPPGSGSFVLKSPTADYDMFPLYNVKETNTLNASTHNYILKPRSLIIFRSYIQHMVTVCKTNVPRITAAFNMS